MIETRLTTSSEWESCCVHSLEELQEELEAAIDAIGRSSLPEVEQSLWKQEMLCATLKRVLPDVARAKPNPETIAALVTAGAALRISQRRYAAVIHAAQATNRLLQDLCSLYSPAAGEVRAHRHTQSVSCEA